MNVRVRPGANTFASVEAAERVQLAADVVAVLADEHVEPLKRHVASRRQAVLTQPSQRNEGRLGGIERADGKRSIAKIRQALNGSALSADDVRRSSSSALRARKKRHRSEDWWLCG